MAFCKNCGAQIQDGIKFCPTCGEPAPESAQQQQQQQPQYQQTFNQGAERVKNFAQNTADVTSEIDPEDIQKNKAMGGLAYFLFFLPLVACPQSKYGRFHANQGLLYLILSVGGGIVSAILSVIISAITWRLWWISSIISFAVGVAILVIGIIGLINGFSGKAKELPIIGKFRIIK